MKNRGDLMLKLAFGLTVLFLFFPVLIVVPMSFSGGETLSFPPESWSLRWYRDYLGDEVWQASTLRSLRIALAASILSTAAGTLAAIGLEKLRSPARGLLSGVIMAPAIIPNVIIALGVFILSVWLGITSSETNLVLAHAMLGLPFVLMIVGAALRQQDPQLERAARVFGAGPVRAFVTATLPPLTPAIVSALIFAFFISFDELIFALFVMGGKETLPVRIWSDLQHFINPTIAAVSTIFIVATTFALTLAELLRRRADRNNAA
ncbi:ABC transporter permease [uncultured Paracoccus sp.]|uniref:ABC transporter permease n=1 Tax=uncultured Paracoccus sp. TaxID=189685 RepID=UPI00262301D2|nr:ABC transporter permease [uncultured Paracoccus sp.]